MASLTKQQKIEHLVLNVPNMAVISYKNYFGVPKNLSATDSYEQRIAALREHARQYLVADLIDLDVLYDDAEGNDELTDPLLESEPDGSGGSAVSADSTTPASIEASGYDAQSPTPTDTDPEALPSSISPNEGAA